MIRKKLSYSDMVVFLRDPEKYVERITKPRPPAETVYQVIGDAVHHMASKGKDARQNYRSRELAKFSIEEQALANELIEKCLKVADDMEVPSRNLEKEKQLNWYDPITGWTLLAKPDEISMFPFGDDELMEIADLKTASRFSHKHRSQLFFFGLVASLAKNYKGPIKLVVKLLGRNAKKEFWYSPKATQASLAKVRHITMQIESFLEERGIFIEESLEKVA